MTGNQAYCQQFKDYGVYLGEKTLDDAASGEVTLLEPVLFQSPIRELGHVEAQSETLKSADGSRELGSVYAERLVFDGEGDAVEAMNQTMQELQASVLSAARTDSMNLDTEMSIDTAETDGSEEEVLRRRRMQRSRSIRWLLRSTEMTRLRIWMIIMSASVRMDTNIREAHTERRSASILSLTGKRGHACL